MLVLNLDIVQLEIVGSLQGQDVRNVFHYRMENVSGGAINIAPMIPLWFINFDNLVLAKLSEDLVISNIIGKNLSNPIQIYEASVTANGDKLQESLPVHDTVSVKLLRTSGITRNGRKAFSGLVETDTADGNVTLSGSEISDIEGFCSDTENYANPEAPEITVDFRPVIVGRTLDVNEIYQLDLSKINPIAGAQVNMRVGTQNTRKF